jgi:HPt (histidine-containing phosphotransfer) domain-containing protein
LRATDGDGELLRRVAEAFVEDCREHHGALRAAVAAGDAATTCRLGHLLKGITSTFGAATASAAAQRLEAMGRQGDLTGSADCLAQLEDQLQRVTETLTAFLEGRLAVPPS